jgi:branched-chain amino acid transport system substrate-binding protein
VRVRWLCLAALTLTPLFAGCGGIAVSPASDSVGRRLTIYSSLPLQGPSGVVSRQIAAGERLALADAGGRVGRLEIRYVSLDNPNPKTGAWDPGVTAANAKLAAQDLTAIAYLGDYDSGATAVSLPLTNGAGILQVSPSSPYVGLTSSLDAGEDEPDRFYPTAVRTFGRVSPGDPVEARAQVALMRSLNVRRLYVLADQYPFDLPLAQMVAADARRAGIAVVGYDTLDTTALNESFTGEISKVTEATPQAVLFSGAPTPGAPGLFIQLHAASPRLLLLGSSSLSSRLFTSRLADAQSATLLGTPALPLRMYPTSAQRVAQQYRARFGAAASAYVLYGYEAMSVVLAAIRAAGRHGDDRQAVIRSFFTTRDRRSVFGIYSIDPNGESSMSNYAIDRVEKHQLVFWRVFRVRP